MSRKGDALSAAAWAGFGALLLTASWRMERLENQGVAPWSAPGLTPGVVGALILVFSVVLAWQALRWPATEEPAEAGGSEGERAPQLRRMALAAVLCVLFAGLSLGHGLPFQVEAAAFILVFTSVFRWQEWRAEGRVARGLAQTLLIAVIAAAAISWVFESLFLVRLP